VTRTDVRCVGMGEHSATSARRNLANANSCTYIVVARSNRSLLSEMVAAPMCSVTQPLPPSDHITKYPPFFGLPTRSTPSIAWDTGDADGRHHNPRGKPII
jgi:hypothetical protein